MWYLLILVTTQFITGTDKQHKALFFSLVCYCCGFIFRMCLSDLKQLSVVQKMVIIWPLSTHRLLWWLYMCGYFSVFMLEVHSITLLETGIKTCKDLFLYKTCLKCDPESWDMYSSEKKMLFTAKINSDAFLFVLSDIPHGLPQRITCCMAVVPYQLSIMVAMFF